VSSRIFDTSDDMFKKKRLTSNGDVDVARWRGH
jgi:hypothetical protein